MPKFLIHTFGCQMNKLDSELITGELLRQGYQPVSSEAEADIILFNACSVRKHAEEKVYSRISSLKSLKQEQPHLIIGLIGCMAQKDKEQARKRIRFLDIVCGPHRYQRIPELINQVRVEHKPVLCVDDNGLINDSAYQRNPACRPNRFQAYVQAMRGCNNFCSYCVVPYVRGKEISRPMQEIIDEVKMLVDDGTKEITLLGQNVTSYGATARSDNGVPPQAGESRPNRDGKSPGSNTLRHNINTEYCAVLSTRINPFRDNINLARLLTRLNNIPDLKRLRFITSHPAYVTDELFKALRDLSKVCPYLHMPAQSGSNKILKLMNRGYTVEEYLDRITKARETVPDLEIVSDFIVGFPGETETDFQDTVNLVHQTRFLNIFVFKYSVRPDTKAAEFKDDVPSSMKKERNNLLLALQAGIAREKHQALVGQTLEIMVEGPSKMRPQRQTGLTDNNYRVVFESPQTLTGELVPIKINSATNLTLYGEINRA